MSASTNYQGQVTWSANSRNETKDLWSRKKCLRDYTPSENVQDALNYNSRYHNLPGRQWTAKAQCEIYFRDKDANVVTLFDICKTLQCVASDGWYFESKFTGPALEGMPFLIDLSNSF